MSDNISRRNFAKYAGLGVTAGIAGCTGDGGGGDGGGGDGGGGGGDGGGGSGNGLDSGKRPMKWIGPAWALTQQQSEKFTEVTGIDLQGTNSAEGTVSQKVLGGLNETMDAMANSAHSGSAVTVANPSSVPVPTDDLDKWNSDNISEIFLDPPNALPGVGEQAEVLEDLLYVDPDSKNELLMPPHIFNTDALAVNPKLVDPEKNNTWAPLYDDQFAGKTMHVDNAIIGELPPLMFMKDNDMLDISTKNINNPSEDQIDQMVDFLVKQKQSGQFRTIWQTFGESVNLFASEEVVLADLWQPAVVPIRKEGTPCTYTTHPKNTVQGYMFFFGGTVPLDPGVKQRNNYDEVLELIETVHWGAWYPRFIGANNNYHTPHFPNKDLVRTGEDETGVGMGPELYDWFYEGKKTYQSVENQALFDPTSYDWSMEEGSPSSDGAKRDQGAFEQQKDRITAIWIFPDNASYLQNEWNRFRSA